MHFNLIETIETENIVLQKANISDKNFIIELFKESDIAENYLVAKDIRNNYGKLITLWDLSNSQNDGIAWIIKQKNTYSNILYPCGFVVIETANSQISMMISYALSYSFRGKGIMSIVITKISELLANLGVEYLEAFISERNNNSILFAKRNMFHKYQPRDKIDTKMILPEELKIKQLWIKHLNKKEQVNFYIIPEKLQNDLFRSNLAVQLLDDGPYQYNFILQSKVTEKLVGISQDESKGYLVKWELETEACKNGIRYMIFTGWGDALSGGFTQFEGHKIGITFSCLNNLINFLKSKNSQLFSTDKLKKVIGLENFNIE